MLAHHHQTLSAAEQERLDERAAILEFEAGWPRVIAESEARRTIAHERWLADRCSNRGWIMPPLASQPVEAAGITDLLPGQPVRQS